MQWVRGSLSTRPEAKSPTEGCRCSPFNKDTFMSPVLGARVHDPLRTRKPYVHVREGIIFPAFRCFKTLYSPRLLDTLAVFPLPLELRKTLYITIYEKIAKYKILQFKKSSDGNSETLKISQIWLNVFFDALMRWFRGMSWKMSVDVIQGHVTSSRTSSKWVLAGRDLRRIVAFALHPCKLQFHFVEILDIMLLFCGKLSWKRC